jgi:hypothetical protein
MGDAFLLSQPTHKGERTMGNNLDQYLANLASVDLYDNALVDAVVRELWRRGRGEDAVKLLKPLIPDNPTNLLEETLESLYQNGRTPGLVAAVFSVEVSGSFADFSAAARDLYYDVHGRGGPVVDLSLKVVGRGWWLERRESEGIEWWQYCTQPAPRGELGGITTNMLKEDYMRD